MGEKTERYLQLGQFIEQRIEALGLGKAEVASAAGMTTETLREIARGTERRRSPRTWAGVERALHLPPGSARKVLDGEWSIADLEEQVGDGDDRQHVTNGLSDVERQLIETQAATLATMQEMLSMQREMQETLRALLAERRSPGS